MSLRGGLDGTLVDGVDAAAARAPASPRALRAAGARAGGGAIEALVENVVVSETAFWRHPEQLAAVGRLAAGAPGPLAIWSAGCATGEEPYSVAIALLEAGRGGRGDRILATDVSTRALAAARLGVYGVRSLRKLPSELGARWLEASVGAPASATRPGGSSRSSSTTWSGSRRPPGRSTSSSAGTSSSTSTRAPRATSIGRLARSSGRAGPSSSGRWSCRSRPGAGWSASRTAARRSCAAPGRARVRPATAPPAPVGSARVFDALLHARPLRPRDLADLRFFGVEGGLVPSDDAIASGSAAAVRAGWDEVALAVRRLRRAGLAAWGALGAPPAPDPAARARGAPRRAPRRARSARDRRASARSGSTQEASSRSGSSRGSSSSRAS